MPATIIWIGGITILFLIQIWNYAYQAVNSLILWSFINNAISWPKISLDMLVFNMDSLIMSVTSTTIVVGIISLATGLILSWIGIKSAGLEKIKYKKLLYVIYFIVYPLLFSFFWFCAIMLDLFRVRKKW
jgi:fatty acid desaturase